MVARAASLALSISLGAVLDGCSRRPEPVALAPANLQAAQIEALRRMNEAGATAFEGRTWHFEFGAGCVLRVRRNLEGRVQSLLDHAMAEGTIDVVPYPGGGFGVKAYGRLKGGIADLFEAGSDIEARAFARHASRLVAPCASAVTAQPGSAPSR